MKGEIHMLTVVMKAEYPAKLKEFLKFANRYFLDQISTHYPHHYIRLKCLKEDKPQRAASKCFNF